ncbi:ATP-binding protein [Sandaracinus amylolyticus]|uniref:ATP-binding protein n=1 Tax=Sandaracinus amylolyticus TaxID=927083 RepID=UPI001F1A4BFE|nr:tetratricopeptide repeat protein [Sandaracinus amylolyticus]UJR86409.1 Hypothetical protein I5071_85040 [Sandaracinus amylolyticus]
MREGEPTRQIPTIPPASEPLIGRDADVRAVRSALAQSRVVSIVGPPGVGKTRLAREIAAAWPERVVRVDAERARIECDLAQAFRVGLDIDEPTGDRDDDIEAIARALAHHGPCLVLVDGLEHVIEPAAESLPRMLQAAPEARFLVASRARMRVEMERVHELQPLSTEPRREGEPSDAARLFLTIARRERAELTDDAHAFAEVDAIVRQLEGLPLAIELCAARARTFGIDDLSRGLARRLDVLADVRRDVPARSATVRGALDESWSLLRPAEQSALAQLSVLEGAFSRETAEAIVDLGEIRTGTVLGALSQLVEWSLVRAWRSRADGSQRFRVPALVRAYAREKLDELGLAPRAESRHRAFFAAGARRAAAALYGQGGLDAARWLRRERDELVRIADRAEDDVGAAVDVTLALVSLAELVGGARFVLDRLERVIVHVPEGDPRHDELLLGRGRLRALAHATQRQAANDLAIAHERLRAAGRRRLEGLARATQAAVMWRMAETEACALYARDALSIARATGDAALEATSLRLLGGMSLNTGRTAEALPLFEEALAIQETHGDRLSIGVTLDRVAAAYHGLGRRDEARRRWTEALESHRRAGHRRWEAFTLSYLGELAIEEGDLPGARALLADAERTAREAGDPAAEVAVAVQRALASLAEGAIDAARVTIEGALVLARGTGQRPMEALAIGYRGAIRLEQGELEAAHADLARAESFFGGHPGIGLVFSGWLAALEAERDRIDESDAKFAQAEARLAGVSDPRPRVALAVQRGFLDLAIARRGTDTGEFTSTQRRAIAVARSRVAQLQGRDDVPVEARAAARRLASAIARAERGAVLEVGAAGRWFRTPGGERVELEHRRALPAILAALARARVETPDAPVAPSRLIEAGWPGERILDRAAAIRLRVAINGLRKAGLRELLITRGGAYLISADVPVVTHE